jgi:nucleoside-diphosphate-sugar epimerase
MRILVTGAAGFVGSHVCEALVARGHEVVGVDAFIEYYARDLKERNLAELRRQPNFSFYELDLRTAQLDSPLTDMQAVIHEAAMPGLTQSWTSFETYMSCNLLATQRLLEACRAAGSIQRFVQISTSSVYGVHAVGDETQPLRPASPYGVTKLAAEHLVLAYASAFGFPATILRYFSIYGPRQRPDMAYNIFISSMLAGRPIKIFGDGNQSRSNTFISDCVAGTLQALEGGEIGEIYNIGGGETITVNQALQIMTEILGVEPQVSYLPARAGDQRHTRADTTRARLAFGYEPVVLPREGLRQQILWQRQVLEPRGDG